MFRKVAKAIDTRKNTVPAFEKWPNVKANDEYKRAKSPKRRSKYSYVDRRMTLRYKGTMTPMSATNTMGTISPCTSSIQLSAYAAPG